MNKIISFEGIDGVGKSSHIALLSSFLKQNQIKHLCTRELHTTEPLYTIRNLLINGHFSSTEELMLISVARSWHWQNIVKPALNRNEIIIIDRFIHSTLAYQGLDIDHTIIDYINHHISECLRPDFVIYLCGEPRRKLNLKDKIESRGHNFFYKVEQKYQELREDNWLVQYTSQSFDEVQHNINQFIIKNI